MKTAPRNILFILSDDQGAWALGAAGNAEIRTPNLDALAAAGTRFENFFCVSPVCSPARASILTGRIPSSHGVHDWIRAGNLDDPRGAYGATDRAVEYLAGIPGTTDFLAEAGWRCGLSGKWHLGASAIPQKGFTWWNAYAFGGGEYFNYKMVREGRVQDRTHYVTHEITEGALSFLDSCRGRKDPFYLSVHYTAPHSPWDAKNHPPEFLGLYKDCPFASTPNEAAHPWQSATAPVGDTPEKRRENLTGYYAAVTAMDRDIGRILSRLGEIGAAEDTLVVFSGDNGMNMGHHGIWGKGNGTIPMNMYDESVKVPFIVRGPGVPAGRVERGLYSHYDLLPTLLDWAGLAERPPPGLPGRSFAPLLRGEGVPDGGDIVVFDEYGPVRMIRDRRWKYVHRWNDFPPELYDLEGDPGERVNLLSGNPDAGALAKADEMKGRLFSWFDRHANAERDGRQLPVAGSGQIASVREHRGDQSAFHPPPKRVAE
ncbi:MAG: sulfatase-like hydrolase/transferase [Spirochaetes bacterium]|nr:sulfatase-like hydrolase/transferase [Spirochaetota bacterium]